MFASLPRGARALRMGGARRGPVSVDPRWGSSLNLAAGGHEPVTLWAPSRGLQCVVRAVRLRIQDWGWP